MVWNHRGINDAFNEAEPRIRRAATDAHIDLDEYRAGIDKAFNPVSEQLVLNPHDAVLANIQRLRVVDAEAWYVAYTDFEGWLMIYSVKGEMSTVQKIGQWSDNDVQLLLFT